MCGNLPTAVLKVGIWSCFGPGNLNPTISDENTKSANVECLVSCTMFAGAVWFLSGNTFATELLPPEMLNFSKELLKDFSGDVDCGNSRLLVDFDLINLINPYPTTTKVIKLAPTPKYQPRSMPHKGSVNQS